MQSPCLDCCQRHRGCHDICPSYQEYRGKKDKLAKIMQMESQYKDYLNHTIIRMAGTGRRSTR